MNADCTTSSASSRSPSSCDANNVAARMCRRTSMSHASSSPRAMRASSSQSSMVGPSALDDGFLASLSLTTPNSRSTIDQCPMPLILGRNSEHASRTPFESTRYSSRVVTASIPAILTRRLLSAHQAFALCVRMPESNANQLADSPLPRANPKRTEPSAWKRVWRDHPRMPRRIPNDVGVDPTDALGL